MSIDQLYYTILFYNAPYSLLHKTYEFLFFFGIFWLFYMIIYSEADIQDFPFTNLIHSTPHLYHTHTFWEFTIVLKGECVNVVRSQKKKNFRYGDVILLRPSDCHYIQPLNEPLSYTHRDIYVSVDKLRHLCDVIDPFLYKKLETAQSPPCFRLKESELQNLNDYFNYFLNTEQSTDELASFHTALVGYLLSLYIKSQLFIEQHSPQWLTAFLTELHKPENFTKKINEIIELTHFSHSYVAAKFKFYMRKTLNEYVTTLRMNYALSLLSSPDFNVTDVSFMLGYSSPTNFTNAFKKTFHLSPKQWIMKQKKQSP